MRIGEQVTIDINELLIGIRRHFWLILFMTVFAGIVAFVVSKYYSVPVYKASSQILVNNSENAFNGRYISSDIDRDLKLVETYSVIIKSPRILEIVKERIKLPSSAALNQQVVISRVKNSQVISIEVSDTRPERAVEIANTIAVVFQSEITSIMKVDNVQILAVAKVPSSPIPVKPKPLMNTAIAMMVGFLGSLVIVFLCDRFNKFLRREKEIERILGLPVLGKIPALSDNEDSFTLDLANQVVLAGNEFAVSRVESAKRRKKEVIRFKRLDSIIEPATFIAEAYRTLRTNIILSNTNRKCKTFIITNSGPGKGKPTTSANLAISLALTGKKVLLIDADMRTPNTHTFFRLDNSFGLSNLLHIPVDIDQMIQKTFVSGLDLLASGPISHNPADLLCSQHLLTTLEYLKKEYEFILIDTPPICTVTDGQVLAAQVDGVLLVVVAGITSKATALKAKQLLEKVEARLVGVILVDPKTNIDRYYYD
jgi:capsular exopolysaccharide synthesis family protein